MNALHINSYIQRLSHGMNPCRLDENSRRLLRKLFNALDPIEPVGDDDRKDLWLIAPRCSYEEYHDIFVEENKEGYTEDEILELYNEEYPDEYVWYSFCAVQHEVRGNEFKAVFLNQEYILQIGDMNENGWYFDASELLNWMITECKKTIGDIEAGIYNKKVAEELPYRHRFGEIRREKYWDIYPGERKAYLEAFTQEEIDTFLHLSEEVPEESGDPFPGKYMPDMTARRFFEACAAGYRAIGLDGSDKRCWRFKESEEERKWYGGDTPRELYYKYADGRDDGLSEVPLDDEKEFVEWLNHEGKYKDARCGGHPWEVIPSFSIEYSLHFGVSRPYIFDREKVLYENLPGYYFSVSGETFERSVETIKFYLAVKKIGYPVYLSKQKLLAARFLETDIIHVIPCRFSMFASNKDDRGLDTIRIDESEKIEELINAIDWIPEKEVTLKGRDGKEDETCKTE